MKPPGRAGDSSKASVRGPCGAVSFSTWSALTLDGGFIGTGGCPSVLCGKGRRGHPHQLTGRAGRWLGLVQTADKGGTNVTPKGFRGPRACFLGSDAGPPGSSPQRSPLRGTRVAKGLARDPIPGTGPKLGVNPRAGKAGPARPSAETGLKRKSRAVLALPDSQEADHL